MWNRHFEIRLAEHKQCMGKILWGGFEMALDKLDLPSLLINLWISSPTNLFDNWKYMWPQSWLGHVVLEWILCFAVPMPESNILRRSHGLSDCNCLGACGKENVVKRWPHDSGWLAELEKRTAKRTAAAKQGYLGSLRLHWTSALWASGACRVLLMIYTNTVK